MPPKSKYSKEQLVDVAFAIACKEGFDSITIRKVAEQLGSSIAPIYVNFKDVGELKHEVVLKTISLTKEIIAEQNSGDTFLDVGIGSVIFAKKYPLLYEELMLKSNNSFKEQQETNEFVFNRLKENSELMQFDDDKLRLLLIKMQALQAGLSLMARKEQYSDILSDDLILKILDDTGRDVIDGMIKRNEGGKSVL